MDIAIPIITLVLGAVLGAWYAVYLKRPRLKVTGSGGGGGPGPGHHKNYVRVMNQPGLLGFRLEETVIMGKRIHGPFERGLTVDRNPASECRATIYDKNSGRFIAPLWWRSAANSGAWLRTVTINSGESFELMLFARLETEPTKYFVFAPENESAASPRIPNEEARFDDTRQFLVNINYSYGRQRLRFDGTMRKEFDGRLYWESAGGGGSF